MRRKVKIMVEKEFEIMGTSKYCQEGCSYLNNRLMRGCGLFGSYPRLRAGKNGYLLRTKECLKSEVRNEDQ